MDLGLRIQDLVFRVRGSGCLGRQPRGKVPSYAPCYNVGVGNYTTSMKGIPMLLDKRAYAPEARTV